MPIQAFGHQPSREASDQWINRIVWRGSAFFMGEWRCGPGHRLWTEENHIRDGHNLVFPRNCVYLKAWNGEEMISTPNQANFYNYGESYHRRVVSPEGEVSEYFVVDPGILHDVIRTHDAAIADRPDRPFRFTHAMCDSEVYLTQRMLFRHVNSGGPIDSVFLEETFLRILNRVIATAYAMRLGKPRTPREDTLRAHREMTDAARRYIALHYREGIQLSDIADAAGTSMFHLCRVFRRQTGLPLHRFLSRMRLRAALDRAADDRARLTEIALDYGFSSHSHFTDSFRREFGFPPGAVRTTNPAALASRLA